MKKIIAFLLAIMIVIPSAAAIDLYVDGRKLEPDSPPVLVQNRTLVPLRIIFEALDAEVQWDNATQTATATKSGTTVIITIDSTTAYVNGKAVTLDVPATLINSRTMVPVRFVSESLDAEVWWEAETETVYVATVENYDGYRIAPEIIFSSQDDENGFTDVFMFTDGTFQRSDEIGGIRVNFFATQYGSIAIVDVIHEAPTDFVVGDKYRVCFMYLGFSRVTKTPAGSYMEIGNLDGTPPTTSPDPAPTTSNPTTTPGESEESGIPSTVYVTPTGKRYHYLASCAGENAIAINISDVGSRTPCGTCVN